MLTALLSSEWITTTQQVIALITGLGGLIVTAISTFFAIKNWVKALKGKKASEIWAMIMEFADAAMKEAEKSDLSGADKKQTVINAVKAACKSAGLNIDAFLDQLSAYIDQTISFVNDMKKKGHDCEGTWEVTQEPTCTTDGKKQMKCTICGVVSSETIPAKGHTLAYRDGVEPTCTEPGKTKETYCKECGEILTASEPIPARGHNYLYIPERETTCEYPGEKSHYICEVCKADFADTDEKEPIEEAQLEIPKKEHTKVLVPGYDADCEKDGLTDGYRCEVCGVTLEEQKRIPRYHVFKGKKYAHETGLEIYEDREDFTHLGQWDYSKQTQDDIGEAVFNCEKCGKLILIKIHGVNKNE